MRIQLTHLAVRTRRTVEQIPFSQTVTFLHGPVGTGKSTVVRLVDYCFGGDLERTPAIQREFVSVGLSAKLGEYECTFERGVQDTQAVRVTWTRENNEHESVSAPLAAGEAPLLNAPVYNLSDLIFHLCGIEPIKVLLRSRDPDSPLIRLSFRDIWWYCYLDQTHLDSSFFRLDDPHRGRKSQDAMRFFTGLHSERLSQMQADYNRAIAEQHGAREAVAQIRQFMAQFNLGSEMEVQGQIEATRRDLRAAVAQKQALENERSVTIHPTDDLRTRGRELSRTVSDLREALSASRSVLAEQEALRAELITTKVKVGRAEQAGQVLDSVDYLRCPQCGSDISGRPHSLDACRLCGTHSTPEKERSGVETEAVRLELNDRIDQIADSMSRRRQAIKRAELELESAEHAKQQLDRQLQEDLRRYDSAFVETIRNVDRQIATFEEHLRSLLQLQEMPRAISSLEERAGASQGRIDLLRSAIEDEQRRLRFADHNVRAVAEEFKAIMLRVGFPGVAEEDTVELDPRSWKPVVVHPEQQWGFWDTGSGGKKTLFNVCYALAVHQV